MLKRIACQPVTSNHKVNSGEFEYGNPNSITPLPLIDFVVYCYPYSLSAVQAKEHWPVRILLNQTTIFSVSLYSSQIRKHYFYPFHGKTLPY
jgi:hypothetical protein